MYFNTTGSYNMAEGLHALHLNTSGGINRPMG